MQEFVHCRPHRDIAPVPKDIEEELLRRFRNDENRTLARFEYNKIETDKNSIGYVEEFGDYSEAAGVTVYIIPTELDVRLRAFYADDPRMTCQHYVLEVLHGGHTVFPHVDPDIHKKNTRLNYWLDLGGSNVITNWYKPTEEYKHCSWPEVVPIPYERLELIESHKIERCVWYDGDWATHIHSVENLEGPRVFLTMFDLKD